MKKIFAATLILLVLACILCACSADEEHVHNYSIESKKAEYIKSEATCATGTVIYYSCLCGERGSETFEFDNKTHNISKTYTDENTLYHTTKATCRDCSAVVSETLEFHVYSEESKNCTRCGHRKKIGEFKAGLYQSGTENMLYSWEELVSEGIWANDGVTKAGKEKLVGDLIIDESAIKRDYLNSNDEKQYSLISERAFYECTGLTRVYVPNKVEAIAAYAFADCDSLENIVFSEELLIIDSHAFYSCNSLTNIEIPNKTKEVGGFAFANCNNVQRVYVGNGVERISRNAFSGLHAMTYISIPASVKQIDAFAFSGCYVLTNIEYRGTSTEWKEIQKDAYWPGYPNEYSVICSDTTIKE